MRLSTKQRQIIREAGLRHFGVLPLLFGSRADDSARGGDIDLFFDLPQMPADALKREQQLWIELQQRLGEQKIDIVVAEVGTNRSIDRAARQQGVAL